MFGEFGGNTIDGGNQGGNVKLGVNVPLGDKAALRVAGYYTRIAGYIDAGHATPGCHQPDLSTREDVNTGDRTGVRAAIKIAPNDRLTITPRIVYQKVETDGWNRIDAFNILANPYTTTRPAVTLGEREQFTQIDEPFNDKFMLGDLNISYNFGNVALTSITSYTDRDIDVVRDAGALTASITGGSIGLPENVYTLDAPLDDATKAKVFTQELRLSGGKDRFKWVAGGFYANTKRDYGQNLLVAGFEDAHRHPHPGARRAQGHPVLLGPGLQARSVRALRRGDLVADRPVQPDRRPALLPLQRGQARRSSTASSATTTTARPSCRSPAPPRPTASRRA